mgnify:CR=1 FL=1
MEWKEVIATDYCYKVADGTHDSPKRQNRGRFLITSKHIKGPSIDFDNAYYISEDDYQKIIKRSKIDKWDVIVSMIGEYCGFCYLEDSDFTDYAVKNVGILKVGERIKSLWLYYYLNSPDGRNQLKNTRAGSSQPYISLGSLRNLLIPEPPREVMESIVTILSSLDRKIELNNKINADLEEMAQAIFKNWFVDFEPFKDGKFVDSELGMIPEGWKVGRLDEIADVVGGSTPSKAKPEYYTQKGIAWLTPKDLSNHPAVYSSRGEIDITEEGYNSTSTKLMPKGTVLFTSRAPIGYISIAQNDICTNQGFKSLVPRKAGTCFLYCFLKYVTPVIENKSTGSTFKEASGSLMKSLQVIMPEQKVFEEFETIVSPLFARIESLEKENSRLSLLRDTLLPRLMSGELEVPE